ncbi:succinate dehydrogenase cytochrome b subunit [Flavobacteriaceae bacterium]|jgi:succinate dehydrogenase / fumarate reductase cytochrome b subunit|nr:succinate dehydrogenase cytochrome b subunit [Flavobacteriaceae bacterium]MDA8849733.1 succinate dehydrogenase cytochrome b subunit [Flavobacteriaceae bacterium]MDB4063629.1 succinate dehydrogenase cytochrome b subunit [Flavobacteriaceae bacterium]MDB4235245.1 succinate dehydrogenase cytochrome b subunit [bacterium]MDC1392545.1 succinate dehydrogenase cytochrome b subunit [Flavobacteriaceae bacterium]
MSLTSSTIGRKVAMALSGLFLVVFLTQHFTINFISVFSAKTFNEISHFMGNNPLVQFVLQPILIFGVVFHFTMGFVLEIQNRKSRAIQYVEFKGSANASWVSRNMIWSGAVVLSFLGLHFYDFWFPEMNYKYIEVLPLDPERYYEEMTHKFHDFIRVGLYIVSFVFLALHLNHGFASSFQSVGVNNKYSSSIKKFAIAFSVIIPVGFIFIALFHYINSL